LKQDQAEPFQIVSNIYILKQDQAEPFQIVSNIYRQHNPTNALQISAIFNCYGPIGGHFGGLIDIATKMALVNGRKPSFEARLS
jgi:hypothetical protein